MITPPHMFLCLMMEATITAINSSSPTAKAMVMKAFVRAVSPPKYMSSPFTFRKTSGILKVEVRTTSHIRVIKRRLILRGS